MLPGLGRVEEIQIERVHAETYEGRFTGLKQRRRPEVGPPDLADEEQLAPGSRPQRPPHRALVAIELG
jgi:hypothetical protein